MKITLNHVLSAIAVVFALSGPVNAGETIKIGFAGSLSGDLASYGLPALNGVKLAVEEINANGGILGRTVEILAAEPEPLTMPRPAARLILPVMF